MIVYCDNARITCMVANQSFHARIKYIEIDHRIVWKKGCEKATIGLICFMYRLARKCIY